MPPIINTFDPLSAASEAVGSYMTSKRQAELDRQAQEYAQKQAAQTQSNADRQYDLQNREFSERSAHDAAQDAAEKAKAELDARREADEALHQARADALAILKERDAKTKNDRDYALSVEKLNQQFKLEQQKLANAKDVAAIHAQATIGAANIRAAATVQAAGIHANATITSAEMRESGADRRAAAHNDLERSIFTGHDATTRRGQDINATTRTNATNAANGRAVAGAVLQLSRMKGAPRAPTAEQDPMFPQAVQQFVRDSPADRARLISNPKVPAVTRAYFQALSGVLGAEPADATVPDPDDDETP